MNGVKMDEIIDLVNSAKEDNEQAFEQLLKKYQHLLSSMSNQYSNMCPSSSSSEKEDFLQEAKIAFYNAIKSYDPAQGRTFGAYAKICIRYRLISRVRFLNSKKRRKEEELKSPGAHSPRSDVVQDGIVKGEDRKALCKKAFEVLSKYEYRIFEMYFSGMKAKEIASKINKSEKSINNAIYRMKSKLADPKKRDT